MYRKHLHTSHKNNGSVNVSTLLRLSPCLARAAANLRRMGVRANVLCSKAATAYAYMAAHKHVQNKFPVTTVASKLYILMVERYDEQF